MGAGRPWGGGGRGDYCGNLHILLVNKRVWHIHSYIQIFAIQTKLCFCLYQFVCTSHLSTTYFLRFLCLPCNKRPMWLFKCTCQARLSIANNPSPPLVSRSSSIWKTSLLVSVFVKLNQNYYKYWDGNAVYLLDLRVCWTPHCKKIVGIIEGLPWEEVFQQIGVACTEHKGCISRMLLINRSDRNDWSAAEGHMYVQFGTNGKLNLRIFYPLRIAHHHWWFISAWFKNIYLN